MMEATSPRIRSLLRQARRTASVGKRAAARQLYREIVEEAPESVEGWLGLARVATDAEEEEAAYRRVLELEPENEAALEAISPSVREEDGPEEASPQASKPEATEADPFEQTRAWLEEATRREPAAEDGQGPGSPPVEKKPADVAPVETADKAAQEEAQQEEAQQEEAQQEEAQQEEAQQVGAQQVEAQQAGAPAEAQQAEAQQAEAHLPEVAGEHEVLVCYRHPSRETGLRCAQCNRPICSKCAVHTPVGYRCPQCIREREDVFYTANVLDYLLAGVTALILGLLAGFLVPRLGFFVIFVGPFAGTLIGRAAFRAARRHHGRWLPHLVAAMVVVGALLPLLDVLIALLFGRVNLFGLLWPAVYVFMATGAAYYQVK